MFSRKFHATAEYFNCTWKLTDGLYNHGVHLVWTELELVARQAGTTGTECISVSKHSSMEDTFTHIVIFH